MSYLNMLSIDELQELIDISTNDPNEKSNILKSLNNVLRLKQSDNKDKHVNVSSGIIESLMCDNIMDINQNKNDGDLRNKVSLLTKQINDIERQYLKNEYKMNASKLGKRKKSQVLRHKKQKKKDIKKPLASSTTNKSIKDLYQTNPQTFYFQNLVKQSISDAVKIEKLKAEIESIKSKLEIQSNHYQSELHSTKTTEYGLEQKIGLIQKDKMRVSQELSVLKEKYNQKDKDLKTAIESKKKIKTVFQKIIVNHQTQKEELEAKLKHEQKVNISLKTKLIDQEKQYKQQIELYNRAQLITNTENRSSKKNATKQTKRLNEKVKSLEKDKREFEGKYHLLCTELEKINAKNVELRSKHKQEIQELVTECREYQLQFQGALRKMEYMIEEKKEIAQQFHKKCQFIEKLQQKLLSQEKMLRNLRTNMQSITKQNTKDAMQSKIKQLMTLSNQWDTIAIPVPKT